jgi:Right handed beta helix region
MPFFKSVVPDFYRLSLTLCYVVSLCLSAKAMELFVAPDGNDARDGRTSQTAFGSISRARDEVGRIKSAGGLPTSSVTVEILGGKYSLEKPLEFSAADSGTKEAPVIYRAYQNQPVEILGGRVLKLSEFAPVTDEKILSRLDASARGKVVSAPIAKLGLKHAGPFPPIFSDSGGIFELFWNGKRLLLSRWPNSVDPKDWATMKKAVVNGDNKNPGTFEYRDERPSRWLENKSIWLKGQWRVPWEDPAMRVAKIDAATHQITFATGLANGIGNKYTRPFGNGKEPWCAVNLIEEIDQPGEWAIDFDSQTLFLWPPSADGELMVSQLNDPMILLNAVTNLQFIGLTLEASLGEGIEAKNVDDVLIAGCTFRNLAKRAVTLDGYRSGVQSCDFYDLGESCVRVGGGDKLKLIPSENFVVNNHMHHYGVLKAMYSAAVDMSFGGGPNDALFNLGTAVGVRVAHNLIHDAPRDAVLVSGQDNVFEYNEISNCGFQSGDVGAFYSWLDWTIRGLVIRYNYIHDTVGGVNPDDGASGNLVYGNVFAGDRVGVWIASGPDHKIINNIFVKSEGPVFGMDDRGAARGYATNSRLLKAVMQIKPAQPPWSTRFPEISNLLERHPELPQQTKFERNLIVMKTGEQFSIKMSKQRAADTNLFYAANNFVTANDPGFVDAAKNDFSLKPDAMVFKKITGFEPIPFEKMGLETDKYRLQLPPRKPAGQKPSGQPSDKNFGT